MSAIEADWVGVDPALRTRLTVYLIEPRPASIERLGTTENAFIVAVIDHNVVFFDDIEETFGTAREVEGMLSEVASYGNIAVALSELERLGADGS